MTNRLDEGWGWRLGTTGRQQLKLKGSCLFPGTRENKAALLPLSQVPKTETPKQAAAHTEPGAPDKLGRRGREGTIGDSHTPPARLGDGTSLVLITDGDG